VINSTILARVLLLEFDAKHKGVEAEKDDHGQGHALDDDPDHRSEHLGLDGAGAHILYLECVNDPHGKVEVHEKVAHVATRHTNGVCVLARYILLNNGRLQKFQFLTSVLFG